jgi:hypothetical protein
VPNVNGLVSQTCSISPDEMYSRTSVYVLNWSKMVVLIVKSTYRNLDFHRLKCEVVQLPNDLLKEFQKFVKPLNVLVKGFNWSMTFPKKFKTL